MVAWVCMIQELYFGPHIMGHHRTWLRGQGQLMANLDTSSTFYRKPAILYNGALSIESPALSPQKAQEICVFYGFKSCAAQGFLYRQLRSLYTVA